jgi:hypothetical protein
MKFDLAFVLIDLDEPNYRAAASEMIRSARRAYKDHDMRVVQLTDNRSAHHPDVDGVFTLDTDVKGKQFCQMKGFVMAEFALKADRPVIFCDVDLIWNNDALVRSPDFEYAHVGCLWREDLACMPFNTGVVMTHPNKQFWVAYKDAIETLPPEICAWWGDQVAMTAADCITGGSVTRMSMEKIAPCITELPSEPLTTPAVHFKGDTKRLMLPYARMLNAANFDFVRPNATVTIDFADWKPDVQPCAGFTF